MVQESWIYDMKLGKQIEITDDMHGNLENGGYCSIFEIITKLKRSLIKSGIYNENVDKLLR